MPDDLPAANQQRQSTEGLKALNKKQTEKKNLLD